ncbi:hypothetical protein DY120_06640 [Apilactobacillus micheneri]|uniref:Uncharacterized protein n=1 Tax=Apilactobacillus micheneri TaxID=1899430 RepID=A0ABY2YWY6_9LACO|nr:hypothetical protein [Apilactobacillus micheneri]TPR24323.1 hypothetical protein DY114_06640 [Apilactobacillus micheneri]TPR25342.1 hypothetical protein DY111_06640 [Apilactobacillus micheneri]TPR27654.1 hypothetical protein DY113_05740 [Apilactobacillus micheneri]TPR28919.1 hypothetical protein DY117_06640 [Apilactobacillus micheneri]TPR29941.1 hypothetical protein DY120_06640 [Apilactobacillus micheneri]
MKEKALFNSISKRNYFWATLIVLFFLLLDIIFSGSLSDGFLNNIKSFPTILNFCLLILLSRNYDTFKIAIQSGINRKKIWKMKIWLILSSAIIVNIFNFIIQMIRFNINDISSSDWFFNNYYNFFSNNILNIIFMFITEFTLAMFLMMLVNTWGSFMSLFNRMWKTIIYVSIIGLFIAFGISLDQTVIYNIFDYLIFSHSNSINNFFHLILGISNDGSNNNPIILIITLIVFTIILSFVNYSLTKLQQVNR